MTSRLRTIAVVFMAAVLILAACGGGKKKAASNRSTTSTGPTTTTTIATVPSPLTGMPVPSDVAARPSVEVKVDNSPDGRPQAGLDKADLLVEEKVEGGVTRFITVFQSQDADPVGPIRSVRTTDANIVAPLGGVFTFSGGAGVAVARIHTAPVVAISEQESGAAPFIYPPGHHRPYATYSRTARLRQEAKNAKAPAAFFDFLPQGQPFAAAGAAPAAKATVSFGGFTSAGFDWDANSHTWLRSTNGTPHTLQDGARLAFTNVIIQFVGYKAVGYKDVAGTQVDEAVVVGSGDAIILVNGQQVKAKWTKASPTDVTHYTDLSGAPIKLMPGVTLVSLPPIGSAVTVQ